MNTNIWISLVKQDTRFIRKTLAIQKCIPKHAEWLNFLRNHDELSLAHINKKLTVEISNAILKFGKAFREGHGISGRSFSLLGSNKKRFLMAYFLLTSLPNSIMLTYGDEFAYPNIPINNLPKNEKKDTRNINRGQLTINTAINDWHLYLTRYLGETFTKRKNLNKFFSLWPLCGTNKDILIIYYNIADSALTIAINLTNKIKRITLNTESILLLHAVNKIKISLNAFELGAYAGVWFNAPSGSAKILVKSNNKSQHRYRIKRPPISLKP